MIKKTTYKEKYYKISEDDMQALLVRAKAGEQDAQNELLRVFYNFLNQYVTLIYYNKYDLSNYDIRYFVALFVKDPRLNIALRHNKLTLEARTKIYDIFLDIHRMARRYGDEEDIRQTINMTFFQCVERYERKASKSNPDEFVPFSGFLYRYFFLKLKKNVDNLLIYQLGLKTYPLITDDDYGADDAPEKLQGFHEPVDDSAEDLFGAEEIDEYWVAGDSALFPFDQLTIQERQLLKWRYVDGKKLSEIARKITEHPNTVREHCNRIRTKIAEYILEQEV